MEVKQTDSGLPAPEDKAIEIRLADIWTFLRRNRLWILAGFLVGFTVGAIYAFRKPNQYSSQVTVMPEVQAKGAGGLGNLGSLAGLAGINLEGLSASSDAIRPDLYPTVMQSVPFALHLLKQPVTERDQQKAISLQAFIEKHSSKSILSLVGSWLSPSKEEGTGPRLSNPGVLALSKEQEEQVLYVQQVVSINYDKKTGIVTIGAILPDPVVAATVAQQALDYLTNYITGYRTEKAHKEVEFLNKQVDSARKRYQQAEISLSGFRDRNRNLFMNTAKIEEQRIQAEFLLAQELYNSLTKQLELAKIKVQEQTPVFKILNPAQVPLRKSKPSRTIIMLLTAIGGALLMTGIRFLRQY